MTEVNQVETKKDLSDSRDKSGILRDIWTKEIENSKAYHANFLKEAKINNAIYRDEQENNSYSRNRYNIFWANTQTLKPLIFSKLPNPNVTRRFLKDDEIGKIASELIERSIKLFLSQNDCDLTIEKARDDFLIGGRGVARVCYDHAEIYEDESEGEKREYADESEKKVKLEYVAPEDFLMSTESEFSNVRWIAFLKRMSRDDLVEKFGARGKKVELNKTYILNEKNLDDPSNDIYKRAEVWEVWDKESKKVTFLTLGEGGIILDELDDPYNLQNFFPIAIPLGSKSDPKSLLPIPLYRLYRSQAEELNIVNQRIKSLIEQCKVTGVYSSIADSKDMISLFGGEDGEFNPIQGTAGIQKISDVVMFKPLTEIITTIRELKIHEQSIIQTIHDITGLSDIVRGITTASETATAQELKGNFAISRIQPLQREVEIWTRDLIRLIVELIVENYSIEELAKMTSLEVIDINRIQKEAQDRQKVLLMEGQSQIDPNDPEAEQKLQYLQEQAELGYEKTIKPYLQELKGFAATPEQLVEIEELIKSDKMRSFAIDVETDSTVQIDQNQVKQQRIEYIGAISNFTASFLPLVQAQVISKDAFNQFLMFVSKPFKVGREVEEALLPDEDMQEEKQPTAEEMLAQAQIEIEKQKLQLESQKIQSEFSIKQQEVDVKKAQVKFDIEKHQDNLEFEDINRQADREAKTLDQIVKARTEILNDQIRSGNQKQNV